MYRIAVSLSLVLVLAGCGTITRGTSDQVSIEVDPADALVRTSYGRVCRGPCTIRAPRGEAFTVTAEKPGFTSQTIEVQPKITLAGATGAARNLMTGVGAVGAGVDVYTGAIYDHEPNPVRFRLRRSEQGPARPGM